MTIVVIVMAVLLIAFTFASFCLLGWLNDVDKLIVPRNAFLEKRDRESHGSE